MPSHFTSLTSNIKEEIAELELGPLTCICGEEESYKSAIGDAIKLALTGKHPIGHFPKDLIKLAANPKRGIEILLSGPTATATWRLPIDPQSKKAKTPDGPHFTGELAGLSTREREGLIPSVALSDLFKRAKGEKTMREALLSRFGGDVESIEEPFALLEEEKRVWQDAIKEVKSGLPSGSTADEVLAGLSEFFRKKAAQRKSEISPIERFITQKREVLRRSSTGMEMLPQKKRQLAQAQAWEESHTLRETVESAKKTLAQIDEEMALLKQEEESETKTRQEQLQSAQEELASLEAKISAKEEQNREVVKLIAVAEFLRDRYQTQIDAGSDRCIICHKDGASVKQAVEYYGDRVKARQQELETLLDEITALEEQVNQVSLQIYQLENPRGTKHRERLHQLHVDYAVAQNDLQRAERALQEMEAPKSYEGPPAGELKEQVERFEAIIEAKEALQREGFRLRKAQSDYEMLKKLEGEAMALQKQVMARVAETASQEVTLGMFGERSAVLDPVTSTWNVTDKSGVPRQQGTMSGTQETALFMGWNIAWTRGSPFRVGLFDDKDLIGLSQKGMQDFFRVCEEVYDRGDLTQIIVIVPDVWLPHIPKERWHKIIRKARALTPSEATV